MARDKTSFQEISYAVNFRQVAKIYNIKADMARPIEHRMNDVYQENKAWIE